MIYSITFWGTKIVILQKKKKKKKKKKTIDKNIWIYEGTNFNKFAIELKNHHIFIFVLTTGYSQEKYQ